MTMVDQFGVLPKTGVLGSMLENFCASAESLCERFTLSGEDISFGDYIVCPNLGEIEWII